MSLDRNSSRDSAKVLERLLPDSSTRTEILHFLAQAIAEAHALAPGGWGVTLKDGMVRLNVGRVEAMAIYQDCLHLVLMGKTRPEGLESISGIVWSPKARTRYRSVPGSFSCDIP